MHISVSAGRIHRQHGYRLMGLVTYDADSSHKCPGGWNCVFGKTCRFSGIEGAHPYPGDFHTKQNYYDSKKGAKGDDAGAGWFSEVKESSEANEASSGW